MSKKEIYIGDQKLLREEKLENGLIKATLEVDKEKNPMTTLTEEDVLFTEEALNILKGYERPDLSGQRREVCRKCILEIVNALKNNAIPEKNIEYVFQMVIHNISIAKDRYFEKHANKSPDKFTVADMAYELEHL